MRIRNLFTACLLLPALTISAQTNSNVEEKKKEINSIKKNSQYIYAEATAATEQEAKDLAEELLYQEINEWVATQKKLRQSNELLISDRKELWTNVSLTRGNMFRSFIYVKKSNIQSADNTEVMTNANPMTPEQDEAASKAAKGKKQEEKAENTGKYSRSGLPSCSNGDCCLHRIFRYGKQNQAISARRQDWQLCPLCSTQQAGNQLSCHLQQGRKGGSCTHTG